jgi:hypothetical protein
MSASNKGVLTSGSSVVVMRDASCLVSAYIGCYYFFWGDDMIRFLLAQI